MLRATGTKEADKKRADLLKANDAFLDKALTADQRRRLKEVVFRQLARDPIRSRTLAGMPEVVGGLKLSDKQAKALAAGDELDSVLTKEQKAAWQVMLGKPFATVLRGTLPGATIVPAPPPPERLTLLGSPAVRKELKLTDAQVDKLGAARKAWLAAIRDYAAWKPDERPAKLAKVNGALHEAIDAALEEGQRSRLAQLTLQHHLRAHGDGAAFTHPEVVTALKMTDSQKEKVQALHKKHREKLAELFLAGAGYDKAAKGVAALKKATHEKLAAALTDDQRDRLKGLIGERFEGEFFPPQAAYHVLVTREILFVTNPALRAELKLTDAQLEKLEALRAKHRADPPAVREARAEQYEQELAAALGPKQRRRFREVVLQAMERMGATMAPWHAAEVVGGLKLTEAQRGRLLGGAAAEDVLTKDQLKKWQAMKGEEFKGSLGVPLGPGPLRPSVPTRLQYLMAESVRKELKLSEDQAAALGKLHARWREATKDYKTWKDERPAPLAKANQEVEDGIDKLLTPAQAKRFEQVLLQQVRVFAVRGRPPRGALVPPGSGRGQGARAVLLYAPAADRLGLTDKQKGQLVGLYEDGAKVAALIQAEMGGPGGGSPPADAAKTLEAFTRAAEKQMTAVLTEKQRGQLKEVLGAPFTGDFRRFAEGFAPLPF